MGKIASIICDGEFPKKEYPRYLISKSDYIVCCDNAFKKWLRIGESIMGRKRLPDAVIGDMDSLPASIKEKYPELIVHISEQEYNDLTKAVKYVLKNYKELSEIHIIGGSGKREDHTIANLSLLMEYTRMFPDTDIAIDMVSDWSSAFAITDTCQIYVGQGREISIFSPDNSLKIKSEGLVWKTDNVVFDNWWKATLNKTATDIVKLTFSHKSMALIIII
jgi:hypothetical protein